MAVEGGPDIVDSGLVFSVDATNIRSYPGNATTNLSYNNGQTGSEYLAASIAWTNSGTWTLNTNNTTIDKPTILDISNLPSLPTNLRVISGVTDTAGSQHHGCGWTNISPSTTYIMSGWFRQNRAGSSGPYLRTNVNNNQIGTFSYNGSTDTNTWPVNTWIRITATGTTQANENAIYLSNYIGSQVGDAVYYYGHQTEVGSTATPLVAGTRSAAWNSLIGNIVGTPTNGPVYSSTGGGSILLDGSNDYVDTGKTASDLGIYDADYTFSCWVYPTNLTSDKTMFGTDQTSTRMGLHLVFRSGTIYQGHYASDLGAGTVSTNQWYNITYTYVKSSGTATIYKDGVSQGSGTISSFIGTSNILLGRWAGGYNFSGNGAMYSIYNRALSASEVLQNFNAQRKRFGV